MTMLVVGTAFPPYLFWRRGHIQPRPATVLQSPSAAKIALAAAQRKYPGLTWELVEYQTYLARSRGGANPAEQFDYAKTAGDLEYASWFAA